MTRFNKTLLAAALGVAMAPVAQTASAEVSANIGVTSNYMWRGVTQADDEAAVSGGIDWAHDSGFYLGTWASNVDFGANTTNYEIDFYGGYAGEMEGFGYDVGLIYYAYPDAEAPADELDFTELYLSGSYEWFSAGLAYTVDTEAGGDDDHIYYWGGVSFDVAPTWSVGGTLGHYDLDGGGDDYTHYQIDVGKSAGDFGDFTLSFSKVDDEDYDDDLKVFVSWGKSF